MIPASLRRCDLTAVEVSRVTDLLSVTGGGSSFRRANRQRVVLIIHHCLNTVILLDCPNHLGRLIRMQPYFFTVIQFDEIVRVFDAE